MSEEELEQIETATETPSIETETKPAEKKEYDWKKHYYSAKKEAGSLAEELTDASERLNTYEGIGQNELDHISKMTELRTRNPAEYGRIISEIDSFSTEAQAVPSQETEALRKEINEIKERQQIKEDTDEGREVLLEDANNLKKIGFDITDARNEYATEYLSGLVLKDRFETMTAACRARKKQVRLLQVEQTQERNKAQATINEQASTLSASANPAGNVAANVSEKQAYNDARNQFIKLSTRGY